MIHYLKALEPGVEFVVAEDERRKGTLVKVNDCRARVRWGDVRKKRVKIDTPGKEREFIASVSNEEDVSPRMRVVVVRHVNLGDLI